jgi:hypothetical protein
VCWEGGRCRESGVGERRRHGAAYRWRRSHRDQRHGRAAEPTTGHPGTQGARTAPGLHGEVQLPAGDLEVVAHRDVGGVEHRAEPRPVARLDRRHRVPHALVLGDDVAGAPAQDGLERVDRLQVRATERVEAQRLGRGRALGAPVAVRAVRERVPDPGVDDEQRQPGVVQRQRHRGHARVGEVEQQGVTRARQHRHGLVHATGRCPDVVVLGPDAGTRQPASLGLVEIETQQRADGHGHGALQGRGAGQPGPQWHLRVDGGVEAGNVVPVVAQRRDHARDVRRPPGRAVRDAARPWLGLGAGQAQDQVVASGQRHGRALGECEWKAETAVVVGVLADQVDPSGRRGDVGCHAPVSRGSCWRSGPGRRRRTPGWCRRRGRAARPGRWSSARGR